MKRPTSIRLPDGLLLRLDERAAARSMDRAAYVRHLLTRALQTEIEDDTLQRYCNGLLSEGEAALAMGLDHWEFLDLLRLRNLTRNVSMEDWLSSSGLL